MKKFVICLLLLSVCFASIIYIWILAGGAVEIDTKGSLRFDSLSSLFAALAFVGVIATVIFQNIQFGVNMAELRLARQEAARSAKAAEDAADNALKQARIQFLVQLYQHQYDVASNAFDNIKSDVLDHAPDHFEIFSQSTKAMQKIEAEIETLTKEIVPNLHLFPDESEDDQ